MGRAAVAAETARGCSIYARACARVGEAIGFDIWDKDPDLGRRRSGPGLGFNEALERLAIPEFDAVRCRNGDDILAPEGRQYATHGFDRQAEIVGNIIA